MDRKLCMSMQVSALFICLPILTYYRYPMKTDLYITPTNTWKQKDLESLQGYIENNKNRKEIQNRPTNKTKQNPSVCILKVIYFEGAREIHIHQPETSSQHFWIPSETTSLLLNFCENDVTAYLMGHQLHKLQFYFYNRLFL